jgi:hypothetical protein
MSGEKQKNKTIRRNEGNRTVFCRNAKKAPLYDGVSNLMVMKSKRENGSYNVAFLGFGPY